MKNIFQKAQPILEKKLGLNFQCKHLFGDASARSFYQLQNQEAYFILCIDPQGLLRHYSHASQQYLELGIPAPQVHYLGEDEDYLLMSFGGDTYLNEHHHQKKLLIPCLQAIQPLWSSSFQTSLPSMDAPFLANEYGHLEQFLQEHSSNSEEWLDLKGSIFKKISTLPLVPCHRDFHSRNIVFPSPTEDTMMIIDIQDSRPGPIYYDLASFLVDPYSHLSFDDVNLVLKKFDTSLDDPSFESVFFQRGFKAINTYIKMTYYLDKNFYFPFISAALKRMSLLYPEKQKNYSLLWAFLAGLSLPGNTND